MKEKHQFNNGQEGMTYWLECVERFDDFDMLDYMSDMSEVKAKSLILKSNKLISLVMKNIYMKEMSAGDLVSIVKLLGARIVQTASIKMAEDQKEELK